MRNLLSHGEGLLVWSLFFVTTLYGQVALKLAAGQSEHFNYSRALQLFTSFWGSTAMLAWVVSTVLWAVLMTRTTLQIANAVSALRFCLIGIAAWWFLKEPLQPRELVGMGFISVGIWFCAR